MHKWIKLFGDIKGLVIGMVHVEPLPGTPRYKLNSFDKVLYHACLEAEILVAAKVDAILVENMHDIPYVKSPLIGPEITSSLTRICTEISKICPNLPKGIQILAGANEAALAVAKAADFQFIRAEGFVFSHVGDEGFHDSCAGPLLRYRRNIDAEHILVLSDIKKKHSSHSITQDVDIVATAKAAEFFLSDGVILTGEATGSPADQSQLKDVLNAVDIPVLIGSGVNYENVENYKEAHGFIVGSSFKTNDRWDGSIDFDKVVAFMEKVRKIR